MAHKTPDELQRIATELNDAAWRNHDNRTSRARCEALWRDVLASLGPAELEVVLNKAKDYRALHYALDALDLPGLTQAIVDGGPDDRVPVRRALAVWLGAFFRPRGAVCTADFDELTTALYRWARAWAPPAFHPDDLQAALRLVQQESASYDEPVRCPSVPELRQTADAASVWCQRFKRWLDLGDIAEGPQCGTEATSSPPPVSGVVPAEAVQGPALVWEGGMWTFTFDTVTRHYPVTGNKCILWLAKLLAKPNEMLSVPDLYGDEEGKLAGDAKLTGQNETDLESLRKIHDRLRDIESIAEDTGGPSEALAEEKANLLKRVRYWDRQGRFPSALIRAYNNIRGQLRTFVRDTLSPEGMMPALADHLKVHLQYQRPFIGYCPRPGTPRWILKFPHA
jgi:hypothetical protein